MFRVGWDWRTWTVGVAFRRSWMMLALLCVRVYVRLSLKPELRTYGFDEPRLKVVK